MLSQDQVANYQSNGYLKVEGLFSQAEVEELNGEMNWLIDEWWGEDSIGWRGPWREAYLAKEEQYATKAVFISSPHLYASAWSRIIFNGALVSSLQSLIGPDVQWHHTVLHAKPPAIGTPFPTQQDYPFSPHDGPASVD